MEAKDVRKLDLIFSPRSVAVVGASDVYEKWGFQVYSAVRESYAGKSPVYAVNATAREVHGEPAYARLSDIPGAVDLVLVTIPAAGLPSLMKECAVKGVQGAVVITGGFAEIGPEGARLQAEMVRVARESGIRIVGPNIMGHLNASSGLITTPFIHDVTRGGISLVSQSGNIAVQVLQRGVNEGIGFSKFVGSGNEADLTIEDYLEYFAQDDDTRVIALYVEGLKDGRRFYSLAKSITPHKPIVAMKAGTSEAGAHAARSHSASIAGSDHVYSAAFKQCGIIRADSVHDLLYVSSALCGQPLPKGKRVGIITIGGGIGVAAADYCRKIGLEVPALSPDTIRRLDAQLPSLWSRSNPVDIIGHSLATGECIMALLEDHDIDSVLCISTPALQQVLPSRIAFIPAGDREKTVARIEGGTERALRDLDRIVKLIAEVKKPVIFAKANPNEECFNPRVFEKANQCGIPIHPTHEHAARVIAHLAWYGAYLRAI